MRLGDFQAAAATTFWSDLLAELETSADDDGENEKDSKSLKLENYQLHFWANTLVKRLHIVR